MHVLKVITFDSNPIICVDSFTLHRHIFPLYNLQKAIELIVRLYIFIDFTVDKNIFNNEYERMAIKYE